MLVCLHGSCMAVAMNSWVSYFFGARRSMSCQCCIVSLRNVALVTFALCVAIPLGNAFHTCFCVMFECGIYSLICVFETSFGMRILWLVLHLGIISRRMHLKNNLLGAFGICFARLLRCCFACWICECDLHAMLAARSVAGVACFAQWRFDRSSLLSLCFAFAPHTAVRGGFHALGRVGRWGRV